MAQHAELRPSTMDVVLGTASRALREARSMRTRRSGSAHWDDGQGGGVVTGPRAGEYGGIGRITGDGMLEPLFDLDPIKQAVDQANGKSDQAIEQAEQVRTQAEAGVAEAKSDAAAASAKADAAAAKAEQVRADTAEDVADVRSQAEAAESKAQAASDRADQMASKITDVTATVNGHSAQLKELSTRVEGAVTQNGQTVESVTELKQTVAGVRATVTQTSKTATDAMSKATTVEATANGLKTQVAKTAKTASDALSKASSVEQTADGITATLAKDYQTTKQADGKYSTKTELSATAEGLSSKVAESTEKADSAMGKATTVEQTAKGLSTQITETARKADTATATANTAKSTADSNSQRITQTANTADSALSKATTVEQNLNGFKSEVGRTYATKSDMGKQSSGSNLWCNQLFDPDKPQITSLVDNVTAPNGSRVNLLANRDNFNPGTSFPVVPGRTYVITAYCKQIKGSVPLRAGIWYTQLTSGHPFDTYVDAESTTPLGDGWMTATWRFTCPYGKSRGCVYFQIEQWGNNLSTQWLVANVTCTDVTGLQPAGDYATNSSLSQTADSIRASVTETARKADAAMSKASSVEQTASGLSTRISEVARKGDQTVQSLNALQTDVTGFKQTVQQTYATGARVSRLESGLDGFKSTVSQTYSPKSEVTNLANSTVRSYKFTPLSNKASWVKLGYWKSGGDSGVASVRVHSGNGFNGDQGQNSEFAIMVKDGSNWDTYHDRDFGVNLIRIRNADGVRAKVISYHPDGQHDQCDIWAYVPWGWGHGSYDISFTGSWQNMNQAQEGEPGDDSTHTVQTSVGYETLSNTSYVDQTSRSVSLGVVEEYKNGQHGSALATQTDITAAKDSITSTVSKTYATQSGVDATYARKTELKQTENSLTLKVQSASDTADSAKTNASNAQSRVGVLETMVRADGNGVRVGKTTNGQYTGYSALVNASGSFDVLDRNNKVVARFSSSGVAIDTGSGIFSINGKEWSAVATGVVNGPYGVRINWIRFGKLVLVNGVASVTGPFHNVTNLSVYEKWPSAPAPADQGTILFNGNNQQNFQIRVGWNGHMELSGSGQPGYWYSYCGVWNVA